MSAAPDPDRGAIAFAERLLTVLAEGRFTATYKYAVLLGLMDLALEHSTRTGGAPTSDTTRQLAEKILELYWPHTVPWAAAAGAVLKQNRRGQAEILSLIRRFRERHAADPTATLARARARAPGRFEPLVRQVEWKLVEMPLPRLQVIGDCHDPFIYRISWTDRIRRREFDDLDTFDNLIRFVGLAGDHLVRLAGVLRPLIRREWAALVARFNRLPDAELEEFLFGVDRASLTAVREPLRELAAGRCFYCGDRVRTRFEVDHFIPWARYPDNGLENLVLADSDCNRRKWDHLAASEHVEAWLERFEEHAGHMGAIAEAVRWERHPARTLSVARSVYPTTTRTSRATASAARCRAAPRAGTCRATTSASARRAAATSPGTGRASARITTSGASTAARSTSRGARPTRSCTPSARSPPSASARGT